MRLAVSELLFQVYKSKSINMKKLSQLYVVSKITELIQKTNYLVAINSSKYLPAYFSEFPVTGILKSLQK